MGRGSMGSSGGSSRGSSGFGGGSSRGSGFSSSHHHVGRTHGHTTVIVGGGHYRSSGSPWVGIIVGAIFILTGLFIVFGGFSNLFKYSTVEATCVLNEKSGGYYYTTYDYTVDGIDYTNRSMQSWEFPEDVGKNIEIYYLKSDPNKIYEVCPEDKGEAGIIIGAGLICAGLGALPLVLCIKELKKKNNLNSNDGNSNQTVKEETYNRCPYCGSKYNKSSNSCPKCGASKMD